MNKLGWLHSQKGRVTFLKGKNYIPKNGKVTFPKGKITFPKEEGYIMKKTVKYRIITMGTGRTLNKGFATWEDAYNWIIIRDYGQYEKEGGWKIITYLG